MVLSENVEHWVPQLTQYLLKLKIGSLSYPSETEESTAANQKLGMEGALRAIEEERTELQYRSLNISTTSTPKREKFFESRRFSGLHMLERMDSVNMRSISNAEEVYMDNEELEEENFQTQGLLVGSRAKQKFWDLYKSERKFKDFDPMNDTTQDPRFAYFQTCKENNCLPRSGLLIKDTENPVIDYTNKFLATTQAASSVAEAVKRLSFPILAVIFVNNSLRPRESRLIMESFQHQVGTLNTLNLS